MPITFMVVERLAERVTSLPKAQAVPELAGVAPATVAGSESICVVAIHRLSHLIKYFYTCECVACSSQTVSHPN